MNYFKNKNVGKNNFQNKDGYKQLFKFNKVVVTCKYKF